MNLIIKKEKFYIYTSEKHAIIREDKNCICIPNPTKEVIDLLNERINFNNFDVIVI